MSKDITRLAPDVPVTYERDPTMIKVPLYMINTVTQKNSVTGERSGETVANKFDTLVDRVHGISN